MSDPTNVTAPMSPPDPPPDPPPVTARDLLGIDPTAYDPDDPEKALPPLPPGWRRLNIRDLPLSPAPSGLTAAQEIRLALALKAMELAEKATAGDIKADDEDIADFVHVVAGLVVPLAAMVEDGSDEVRHSGGTYLVPGVSDMPAACPDPSLHEEDLRGLAKQFLNQRDEAHEQRDKAYEQRDAVEEANRVLGVKFDGANARVAELERQRDVAEERLSRISGLLAAVEDDPPHGEIPAQAIADVFAWVPEDDRAICAEPAELRDLEQRTWFARQQRLVEER
jgi:hypothetical protein